MINTSSTTATTAQSNTRVYESVTRDEITSLGLGLASQVHTCKQASAYYRDLADRFGPSVAKEILALAKRSVKAHTRAVTDDAKAVRNRLSDGGAVARDTWKGLLADEDVQGRAWARAVYESANCDLLAMVTKYADFVADVTVDGQPVTVVAKRTTRKGADGERESG